MIRWTQRKHDSHVRMWEHVAGKLEGDGHLLALEASKWRTVSAIVSIVN